jgi:hypothetical protein
VAGKALRPSSVPVRASICSDLVTGNSDSTHQQQQQKQQQQQQQQTANSKQQTATAVASQLL